VSFRGAATPGWQLEAGALPRLPWFLCSARGKRWPEEPVLTPSTASRAPGRAHIPPYQHVLTHGSVALGEDPAAWPLLGRRFGQTRVPVGRSGAAAGLLEEEEAKACC